MDPYREERMEFHYFLDNEMYRQNYGEHNFSKGIFESKEGCHVNISMFRDENRKIILSFEYDNVWKEILCDESNNYIEYRKFMDEMICRYINRTLEMAKSMDEID